MRHDPIDDRPPIGALRALEPADDELATLLRHELDLVSRAAVAPVGQAQRSIRALAHQGRRRRVAAVTTAAIAAAATVVVLAGHHWPVGLGSGLPAGKVAGPAVTPPPQVPYLRAGVVHLGTATVRLPADRDAGVAIGRAGVVALQLIPVDPGFSDRSPDVAVVDAGGRLTLLPTLLAPVDVSVDGRYLLALEKAAGSGQSAATVVYDLRSRTVVHRLSGGQESGARFVGTGSDQVLLGSGTGYRRWTPATGQFVALDTPPGWAMAAMTPDGTIWLGVTPAAPGRPVDEVSALRVDASGTGFAVLWRQPDDAGTTDLSMAPSGERAVVTSGQAVRVVDLASGRVTGELDLRRADWASVWEDGHTVLVTATALGTERCDVRTLQCTVVGTGYQPVPTR